MIDTQQNRQMKGTKHLVADYISSLGHLSEKEKEDIVLKIFSEDEDFQIRDINFQIHGASLNQERVAFRMTNNVNLEEIIQRHDENVPKNESKNLKIPRMNFFNFAIDSKLARPQLSTLRSSLPNAPRLDRETQYANFTRDCFPKYSLMKTSLGHLCYPDEQMMAPVPIYCICVADKLDLFITGDNNGIVKVWSLITGALVETFNIQKKAINDLLLIDNLLISCSEDMSLKILDLDKLIELKTMNFDEEVIRVASYKYTKLPGQKENEIIVASSNTGKTYVFSLSKVLNLTGNDKPEEEWDDSDYTTVNKIYLDKTIIDRNPDLKKVFSFIKLSYMTISNSGIIACGFTEGLLVLWDLEKILHTIFIERKFLIDFEKYLLFLEFPHDSIIQILEFNNSNDKFITGSVDGNVFVWDIRQNIIEDFRLNKSHYIQKYSTPERYVYPIYLIGTIKEDEQRIQSSVNVATWSCYDNYVITIISSKRRKKLFNQMNQEDNENKRDRNAIIEENKRNSKRDSALFVFNSRNNKLICRIDGDCGLSIDDECYVLEAHPRLENIIVTVSGSNQVVVFDIFSRSVISKFTVENYFFNNISDSLLILEGKFSSKGDCFVISTYLGTVSIYSIYSDNSYRTTYMDQFYEEDFGLNPPGGIPKLMNMYNITYMFQQPFARLKQYKLIGQLRKDGYDDLYIRRNMIDNYVNYNKNLEERLIECAKQEQILKQGLQDNVAYMLPNEEASNMSESRSLNASEYDLHEEDQNREISDQSEDKALEMVEDDDLNDNEMSFDRINEGHYNLRSNRRGTTARETQVNTRSGSHMRNNSISRDERYRIRASRQGNTENNIPLVSNLVGFDASKPAGLQDNIEDCYINIDDLGNDPVVNEPRSRKRVIIEDEEEDHSVEANCFTPFKNKKTQNLKKYQRSLSRANMESNKNSFKPRRNMKMEEDETMSLTALNQNMEKCRPIVERCYICSLISKELIGPFYTLDHIEFNVTYPSRSISDDIQEIYIHYKCLISHNCFIVRNKYYDININASIKAVLRQSKECFRCGFTNATLKCESCDRFFHGFQCACLYMEECTANCFDCFAFSPQVRQSINLEDFVNIMPSRRQILRAPFLNTKFSDYCFYPQKGVKYYFILQAYEEYLKCYFYGIRSEIDKVFFWKNEFLNLPVLCELVDMEYCFCKDESPFAQSIFIKLTLLVRKGEAETEDFEFKIIFFPENNLPDFLIHHELYKMNRRLQVKVGDVIPVLMDNYCYDAKVINIHPKENRGIFSESEYESIHIEFNRDDSTMIRLDEGNETVSRISFWEIYNSNMPKTREESLIIKNSQKLIDFIEKKILTCSEFSLFRELVDENEVEDYYDNIPISMSISNIIEKLKNSYYLSERAFLFDLNLIALNSERFNGAKSPITFSARKLVERLKSQIQIRERSALEKQIDIGIDEEFLNRKRQRREVASNSKENIEKEIVKSAKKSRRKVNSYESVDKENNSDGFEPNEASEINSSLRLMVDLPIHMGRQTRNSMRGININGNSENRRILRSTKLN